VTLFHKLHQEARHQQCTYCFTHLLQCKLSPRALTLPSHSLQTTTPLSCCTQHNRRFSKHEISWKRPEACGKTWWERQNDRLRVIWAHWQEERGHRESEDWLACIHVVVALTPRPESRGGFDANRPIWPQVCNLRRLLQPSRGHRPPPVRQKQD